MDFEKALRIFRLIDSCPLGDETFVKLKKSMFTSAVRYARIRADWAMSSLEEKKELSESRTRAHNALIDDCNILSRYMAKYGSNTSWREALGDDRASIGDFACFLHCIIGLKAK